MKAIYNPFGKHLQKVFNEYADFDVPVTTVTSDYTVTVSDHVVLVDALSGAVIITLPTLASIPNEKIYHVKKIDISANVVTIQPGG